MRTNIIGLVVLLFVAWIVKPAFGVSEVSGFYDLFSHVRRPGLPDVRDHKDDLVVHQAAVLIGGELDVLFHPLSGFANASVFGVANPGLSSPKPGGFLGVSIVANALLEPGAANNSLIQTDGSAVAILRDQLTLKKPNAGGQFKVDGYLRFTGSYSANAAASGSSNAFASALVKISVNDAVKVQTGPFHSTESGIHSNPAVPTIAPFSLTVTPNMPVDFKLELQVGAESWVNKAISGAGDGASFVDADFKSTLSWGGITSVTDSITGQTIEGWTVESESGFDYSLVFEVPEPSALILFAVAMAGLLMHRRRCTTPAARVGQPPRA